MAQFRKKGSEAIHILGEAKILSNQVDPVRQKKFQQYRRFIEYYSIAEEDEFQKNDSEFQEHPLAAWLGMPGLKMSVIPEEMEHELENDMIDKESSESDVKENDQIFEAQDEILRKEDEIKKMEDEFQKNDSEFREHPLAAWLGMPGLKMPAVPEEMEHELENDMIDKESSESDVKENDQIFEAQDEILRKEDEIKKMEDELKHPKEEFREHPLAAWLGMPGLKMSAVPEEMEHELENDMIDKESSESDVKENDQIFEAQDEILRKEDEIKKMEDELKHLKEELEDSRKEAAEEKIFNRFYKLSPASLHELENDIIDKESSELDVNKNDQNFEAQDEILRKEDEIMKMEDELKHLEEELEYSRKKSEEEKIFNRFYKLSPAFLRECM